MAELATIVSSFLGTAAALTLGLFALKALSGRLIEHRLAIALQESQQRFDEKLARVEAELGRASDLLSRRNEREFAVAEQAWELMMRAFGAAQEHYLFAEEDDLDNYEEQDVAAVIDSYLLLSEGERRRLKDIPRPRRQKLFEMSVAHHRMVVTEKAWGDFKNSLTAKQIFMTSEIYGEFLAIAHELSDNTLALARARAETGAWPDRAAITMKKSLGETIDEMIDRLGAKIRSRFGFEESVKATAPSNSTLQPTPARAT
jgi:hypothetical protein